MLTIARDLLKRNSSPAFFGHARSLWRLSRFYGRLSKWYWSFFAGHTIASFFVKKTPKIQSFPRGQASELVTKLQRINVFAPTAMCRVMTGYGSDKGRGWHNYTTIYSVLFGKFRGAPLRILELGLGTDNPSLASSMGENGKPGASLRGWRKLFPRGLVYGADIDRDILFREDRIETFYCDQCDSQAIRQLWSQPALREEMDIIIDDGLHTFEGNISFLESSLEHVRPGGIYVVEDIVREALDNWRDVLETQYTKRFPGYEFALLELPNEANPWDNNLRRRLD